MPSIDFGPRYRSHEEDVADFIEAASPLKVGELLQTMLEHYIGPEKLIVRNADSDSGWQSLTVPLEHLFVSWSSDGDVDIHLLPPHIAQEFCRLRIISWLTARKRFDSAMQFCMAHYLLSVDPLATLPHFDNVPDALAELYTPGTPFRTRPLLHATHPAYPLHGLEKVTLDLEAAAYIFMFKVRVPPFNQQDAHVDTHLHGAASLLQHCEHLSLRFGFNYRFCDPWNCIPDQLWSAEARERTNTCSIGKVVDWILEYTWVNEYLQHLETVALEGDVQDWVREKWEREFVEWKEVKKSDGGGRKWQDVHTPDIEALESQGMRWDEEYDPEDHYPPVCMCNEACSSIGRVLPTLSDLMLWPGTEEAEPVEDRERDLQEWETRAPGNDADGWIVDKEEDDDDEEHGFCCVCS